MEDGVPTQEPSAVEPTADPPPATETPDSGIPRLAKLVATVTGSTTAIAALLFYFGWSRAYYFYDYLGVDSSVLDLTTRDYIQLSVDGLFVPAMVAACVTLLVLWAHAALGSRLARRLRTPRLAVGIGAVGLLLVANGLSSVERATPLNRPLGAAPLSLALGAVLVFYGLRLWRQVAAPSGGRPDWVPAAEWTALFTLLGLSVFWIANDYSAEVGETRAREYVAQLRAQPDIDIFSTRSLSLSAPGVREVRCTSLEAAYQYRYDGLKLVLQAGDAYLLLPASWSRTDGVAVLLPRDDTIRLQFSRTDSTRRARPAC